MVLDVLVYGGWLYFFVWDCGDIVDYEMSKRFFFDFFNDFLSRFIC